jgi:butyryl-CoA dehydrogenase
MSRLAQTLGLTEFQTEIIDTVRTFVDRDVIPVAQELEHSDTYPQAIVDKMRDMGLFGLMIPEEYGGLGESLLTYALCVEELARGWMSVSGVINTHFIVAYMLRQHGTDAQKEHYLPRMATGEVRGAEDVADQRWQLHPRRRPGSYRGRCRQEARQSDRVPHREARRIR